MTGFTFFESIININGKTISLPYEILDAYVDNGIIVILIDPDAYIGKEKNFKNLIAFNISGEKLWEADFPQHEKPDYYWKFSHHNPLIVKSFSSRECEIDLSTGKLLRTEFYK